ncbi:MAG: VOC family protein [Bacillaceae bacterium]|nr:VOC family protein [Bacillaceae bacterium]
MRLVFLYQPVKNLKESLAFYRDELGFEEAWREGEHTAALKLSDSNVRLMIEDIDEGYGPGGVFLVDSVDEFFKENQRKLDFLQEPVDIPPGRYAIFQDNSGNPIRILDFTNEQLGGEIMPLVDITIGHLNDQQRRKIARGISDVLTENGIPEDTVNILFRHVSDKEVAKGGGYFPYWNEDDEAGN